MLRPQAIYYYLMEQLIRPQISLATLVLQDHWRQARFVKNDFIGRKIIIDGYYSSKPKSILMSPERLSLRAVWIRDESGHPL